MSLTFLEDRPVAISGIAKILHDQTGSEYLAGIWRDTVIEDLMWVLKLAAQPRPKPSRAPSWSWLSIEGHVANARDSKIGNVRVVVEITEINIDPPNSFGRVANGVLKLKVTGMLKVILDHTQHWDNSEKNPSLERYITYHDPSTGKSSQFSFRLDCSDWYKQGQELSKVIYLLPFCLWTYRVQGLLVIHPKEMKKGSYVRIGQYRQNLIGDGPPLLDKAKFNQPLWARYNWNDPKQNWESKITADDFVSTEWIDGEECGTIEIH